jgi:hypothetical protein
MKKIITLTIFLMTLANVIYAEALTPEKFLETYSHSNEISRHYFGNILLTVGLPALGTSFFMEDPDIKSASASLGGVYTGMGLLMKLLPTDIEIKEKQLKKDQNKTALGQVVQLKNTQKQWRYVTATLFAVPILFDFSIDKTVSNPYQEDANISIKTIFASTSIGMLIFKTPFEQLCDEVILGHNKRNISLQFSPGFDKNSLAVVYNF